MPSPAHQRLLENTNLPYETRTIQLQENDIHYVRVGAGKKLLFLHGANIGWIQWAINLPDFSDRFELFLPDLPGSGASSSLNFTQADLIGDFVSPMESFIREVLNNECYAIIGHSLGAWIGWQIKRRANVDVPKIVLTSPIGLTDYLPPKFYPIAIPGFHKILAKTAVRPTQQNLKGVLESVMFQKKFISPDLVTAFHHNIVNKKNHPFELIHRLVQAFHVREELLLDHDSLLLGQDNAYFIIGDKDPFIPHRQSSSFAEFLRHKNIAILPDVGHVPSLEDPQRFRDYVLSFL